MTTISGTSINDGSGTGTDLPFVVQETEGIALNNSNYLTSPRIIASRVNEIIIQLLMFFQVTDHLELVLI